MAVESLSLLTALALTSLPDGFCVLDPTAYKGKLRDDYDWAVANIPFVDVLELPDVHTAYYYRWRSYKRHIKSTPDGWVVSEFLPDVPWAGKYNTIPAAAGHHIMEGRWMHNSSYIDDYLTFWFRRGGAPRRYTAWFAWAAWQRHMVTHDVAFIRSMLPDLLGNMRAWIATHLGDYGGGRVCWWQNDGADAMEVSISGSGCRPTINSVMFGEAVALLEIAKLSNNKSIAAEALKLREQARRVVLDQLWNEEIGSFANIPLPWPPPSPPSPPSPPPPGFSKFNTGHGDDGATSPGHPSCPGNGSHAWAQNKTVTVRELLGYLPWYFSLPTSSGGQLISTQAAARYLPMWKQLFDPDGFAGPWGLRTAERRSPCYNYSYSHHDCWNGPSWPYETARVLTSAANVLNDYDAESVLTSSDYVSLLVQYAQQHTRTSAVNDTASSPGSGHVFELVHPDLGYWIDRFRLYMERSSMRDMGDDYNHSTFIDLVLSGLFGFRPRPDKLLVLNPLLPVGMLSHFAVDHVRYHGHALSFVWDEDGSHYHVGVGFQLLVDGKVVAASSSLTKLTASLP